MPDDTTTGSKQQTLQTVERALTFLEHVGAAPVAPTVQDVAAALKLNITTCYHLMRTLLARGYLERGSDARLRLGIGVAALFRSYRLGFNVDQSLAAEVHRLAEQTSETCFLSVLQDQKVILKVLVEGSQPLRVGGLFVGLTGNEHRRASGKAVLANLDEPRRDAMLARSLSAVPASDRAGMLRALRTELQLTRERGWSMDGEQVELGISGIGAPVMTAGGDVFGAVGVIAPSSRMDRSKELFIALTVAAAGRMSELIDYSGSSQAGRGHG